MVGILVGVGVGVVVGVVVGVGVGVGVGVVVGVGVGVVVVQNNLGVPLEAEKVFLVSKDVDALQHLLCQHLLNIYNHNDHFSKNFFNNNSNSKNYLYHYNPFNHKL